MRWLVVALVVLGAAPAGARVVMRPSIQSSCASGPSWDAIAGCMAKFGTTKVVHSGQGLRVAQIADAKEGFRVPGIYLYVQHDKRWVLGGSIEGTGYSFLSVEKMTAGRFHGYRFDVRLSRSDDLMVDERAGRVLVRSKIAVFCSGYGPGCARALTACDVYLEGKSYWMFRGKVEPLDREVRIRGDRSTAGDECKQDEIVGMPFNDPELF